MQAGTKNLTISKKASFEETFYLFDGQYNTSKPFADPSQPARMNLTGCTGVALVKDMIGGTTVATLTVTFPNPTLGEVRLALTAAQTTSLNFKSGVWDIFITFPSGKVDRYLQGNATVELNVS
jgi:hypothetical protein